MNIKSEAKNLLMQRLTETPTTVNHFDPSGIYKVPSSKSRQRNMLPDLLAMTNKDISRDSILHARSLDANATSNATKQASAFAYKVPSKSLNLRNVLRMVLNYFKKSPSSEESSSGYRIIVSNLPPSITKAVVENLFKCIGNLIDSRIVKPGVAEVIYKSLSDAQQAVDIFHNSDMNDMSMQCLLVHPRASNESTVPAKSSSNL